MLSTNRKLEHDLKSIDAVLRRPQPHQHVERDEQDL